jgi:hypothetical protein
MRYLQRTPECPGNHENKIPSSHELHGTSIYSVPKSIYKFSSGLVKELGTLMKSSSSEKKETLPHEYRTDNCGNVWCLTHGTIDGTCMSCNDGLCEEALQRIKKQTNYLSE